ncbi:alpha/beta hydrolase [Leptospira langatensis]|uniref:Alpha/beta hydrolase n=1 Tax=Leptospira langatensis TaxID=2484983 RepID=A0A5F1ZU14_9LEPT|nr:alpha/beta hydrolase [Leptospira langatensis]TGK03016.1 alpha/beta hydrolase [Leptospira langatensis]TGL41772.1 alpha/beta hydrolase [Leptospira langatensis]
MKRIVHVFLLGIFLFQSCRFLGLGSDPFEELKAKYANSESKFAPIGDLNIHYRDEGKGPVVVLLHGVSASLHTWDAWAETLKSHYRVIRIDLPGHGLTGPPKDIEKLNLEEGVEIVNRFLESLKVDSFYLVGNSMGGYISWNYSLKYPQKVKKMVLIDAAGYAQPLPFIIGLASHPVVSPVARHMLPSFLVENSVMEVYGDPSKVTQATKDKYVDLSRREGNKEAYNYFFRFAREKFTDPKISEAIKQVRTPTLIMWGTNDRWLKLEYAQNWTKDIPNSKFIAYEGAGHIPMEEIPEQTSKDLVKFLEN